MPEGIALPAGGKNVGLPARVFLFTLDQISVMTEIPEPQLMRTHIYFEGRSIGSRDKALLSARNIAPKNRSPDWRVAERELIRWLRHKGFRYYDRGVFSH